MPRKLTRTEQAKKDYETFFVAIPDQKNPTDPNTLEKCEFLLYLAGIKATDEQIHRMYNRCQAMQSARKQGREWARRENVS